MRIANARGLSMTPFVAATTNSAIDAATPPAVPINPVWAINNASVSPFGSVSQQKPS